MWEGLEMASLCPGRGEGERNYNCILKIINEMHAGGSATSLLWSLFSQLGDRGARRCHLGQIKGLLVHLACLRTGN